MGYRVIDPSTLPPHPEHEADRRTIKEVTDLQHIGFSTYEAEPGDQVPQKYHYHDTQEELFYVIEGELSVETPDEVYVVGEGQVFIAEPGSPHRAFNDPDADGVLRLVAIGSPVTSDGHRYDPPAK